MPFDKTAYNHEYYTKYRLENADKIRESNRLYRERHKDKLNKKQVEYRLKNKDKNRAYNAEYRLKNKESIKLKAKLNSARNNEYARGYRLKNPDCDKKYYSNKPWVMTVQNITRTNNIRMSNLSFIEVVALSQSATKKSYNLSAKEIFNIGMRDRVELGESKYKSFLENFINTVEFMDKETHKTMYKSVKNLIIIRHRSSNEE